MHIWNQTLIPVVLRRTGKGQRLRVRLPYADTNRQWRQNGRQTSPNWAADGKYWELPKAWFDDFVDRSLSQYTKVYIIQPLYVSSGARYLHRPEDLRRNSRYVLPSRYDADAPVARPSAIYDGRPWQFRYLIRTRLVRYPGYRHRVKPQLRPLKKEKIGKQKGSWRSQLSTRCVHIRIVLPAQPVEDAPVSPSGGAIVPGPSRLALRPAG